MKKLPLKYHPLLFIKTWNLIGLFIVFWFLTPSLEEIEIMDSKWDELDNRQNVAFTKGTITKIIKGNYDSEDEEYEYAIEYNFPSPFDESTLYGTSYTYSKKQPFITLGSTDIRYHEVNPHINTLSTRNAIKTFSGNPNKFGLLKILGLSLLITIGYHLYQYLRKLKLINKGELTSGKLVGESKDSENNRAYLTFHYKIKDSNKTYKTEVKVQSWSFINSDYKKLKDNKNEPLLYLPDNPTKTQFVDILPKSISNWIKDNRQNARA